MIQRQLQHKSRSNEQMCPVHTHLDEHLVLLDSDADPECQNVRVGREFQVIMLKPIILQVRKLRPKEGRIGRKVYTRMK